MALSPEMRAGNGGPAGQTDGDGAVPEGTLQLLPGRLVVESGEDEGREIRLARIPGRRAEITFGRSPGRAHEHVQLRSRTVSRLHARLIHEEGRWLLRNESTTNPTVLNGTSMGEAVTELLSDGDRVEMGEVTFRFRHPPPDNRLPSRSSWYTDGGRRPSNQDAVAVRTLRDGRELAVVCDGMGAHAAGGLASHRALESLLEALEEGMTLERAVRIADKEVRSSARQDPEHQGMGTTLVAMLRDDDSYRIANVGDSRAYRIDRHGIRQVTEDHSFVAEAVRDGSMSPEEAGRSPWRNAVTRHLGADEAVEVDTFGPFPATEPHLVILTSDGAHSVLAADRLHELARDAPSVRDIARDIGEAALREGSDDNVTVAVVRLGAGSWHSVDAGRSRPRHGEQIAQETQPAD